MLPPSTAPCHPAPGRRLLIIRNDNQSPPSSLLLGFDGIVPSASTTPGTTQPTAYKRHSSLAGLAKLDTADSANPKLTADSPSTTGPNKKRWTFMGKILPSSLASTPSEAVASSPTNGRGSPTKTQTLEEARRETAIARSRPQLHSKHSSTDSETPPATSNHRAFSFKFSLEWSQHFEKPQGQGMNGAPNGNVRGGAGFNIGAERRLSPPRLPAPAQAWLGARVPGISKEIIAKNPNEYDIIDGVAPRKGEKAARAKYAGRALAEWALVVGECNNFVERRRAEGVPTLRWVEVPTLGVEGFRRFG